jgi:hypothetical protein
MNGELMQTIIVWMIVATAVGLVARALWRQLRSLRAASRGPAGCDAGCGCDVPTSAGAASKWDDVAPVTTRARR